jgi:hypothetical protein
MCGVLRLLLRGGCWSPLLTQLGYKSVTVFGDCFDKVGIIIVELPAKSSLLCGWVACCLD